MWLPEYSLIDLANCKVSGFETLLYASFGVIFRKFFKFMQDLCFLFSLQTCSVGSHPQPKSESRCMMSAMWTDLRKSLMPLGGLLSCNPNHLALPTCWSKAALLKNTCKTRILYVQHCCVRNTNLTTLWGQPAPHLFGLTAVSDDAISCSWWLMF